ncbi:MAG: hypothetical protein HQ481_08540 [Alphaproteobacteria bacterium]|nr:hypothetical protein [Alphaproteobacteria bacterium]
MVFSGLLMWMQVEGFFQPPRPLTDDSIAQHLMAGVVFGFAMYILGIWKQRRLLTAESAAREAVRKRLAEQADSSSDDDRPA